MKRRGRGRPKLPRERARRLSVHVTVSQAEKRRIKRAAARAEMTVSAWARERLLSGLPPG